MGAFDQLHRNALDSPGDVAKEAALLTAGELAIDREGFCSQCCRQIDIFDSGGVKCRIESSSSRRIEARKLGSACGERFAIQK